VSQGISQYDILNRHVTALTLDLSRDGKREGVLTTEMRQHIDSRGAPTFDPSTEAGISQSLQQDVYVELASIGEDQAARIRVAFNPLVTLVWIGGALMTLGGLIAMWPFQAGNRN
jgi:cytochrome c-type biogenesis protein CcmF